MIDRGSANRLSSSTSTSYRQWQILVTTAGLFILSGPTFAPSNSYLRQTTAILTCCLLLRLFDVERHYSAPTKYSRNLFRVFLLYIALSSLFLLEDNTALLAALSLGTTLLFGGTIARRLNPREFTQALLITASFAAAVSISMGLIVPDIGLVSESYQQGALKGIYIHRNHLAFISAIGIMAGGVEIFFYKVHAYRWIVQISLVITALIWSESATAYIVTFSSLMLLLILKILSIFNNRYRIGFIAIAGIALFLIAIQNRRRLLLPFLDLLDRDVTLTGRTGIWEAVIDASADARVVGHGWGTVWTEFNPIQESISTRLGFRVHHAHNSYLDLLLQTGVVGTLILLSAVLILIYVALRAYVLHPTVSDYGVLTLSFLALILISSLSEARLVEPLALASLYALSAIHRDEVHSLEDLPPSRLKVQE